MKPSIVRFAASVWLGLAASFITQAAPPPGPEVFGRGPAIDSVVLSPNGRLLAWISHAGADPVIEVFDLAKDALWKRVTAPKELKLRDLAWADDEVLLILSSVTRPATRREFTYEFFRTVALEVASAQMHTLLHSSGGAFNYVLDARLLTLRTSTPKKVIMSSWNYSGAHYRQETGSRLAGGRKDDGWINNLYEVDTLTGAGKLLEAGTPFTYEWAVSPNGDVVARSEWEAQRSLYTVLLRNGQGWKEIFRLETSGPPALAGVLSDGTGVLLHAALERKYQAIWRVTAGGGAPQPLVSDDAGDILAMAVDPHSLEILGGWTGGLTPEIRWFDERAGKRARSLQKTFAGKHAQILGRSTDWQRALVRVGTHSTPAVYYMIDFSKGTADIVGEAFPALENVPLGEVRNVTYAGRDGYSVPAYLTLPPALTPEKLPLIVLPHGGPEARDEDDFDIFAQFLATQGYAVLQPQFRGSIGFGEEHRTAGYRQWGKRMQDDLSDGVRAMIDRGIADPHRVCIVGASYGGYAALAGAAFTPELYACAVSINGISDLPNFLGNARHRGGDESDGLAYWAEHIGPVADPDVIARSPARAANRVRAPILLMHGVNDSVVPIAQSKQMMKALQGQRFAHEFVELPAEDHWLSNSETRVRVFQEMQRFLGLYIGTPVKQAE